MTARRFRLAGGTTRRDSGAAGPADLEAAALRWGLPLVDVGDLRAWL